MGNPHDAMADDDGALTLADFRGRRDRDPRRREDRVPCSRRVAVLPYAMRGEWKFGGAWLLDCSPHGVGLLTGSPMNGGDQFLLKLKARGMLLLVVYTVRYCRPADGGRHRIGAEFGGFLRTGELEDAGALFRLLLSADEADPSLLSPSVR